MESIKKSCKIASEVLEMAILVVLLIQILTKSMYVGVAAITLSAVSIVITILGMDKITIVNVIKDLKVFLFLDALLFAVAKNNGNDILLYITIAIGVVLFLASCILMFETDEKDNSKHTKYKKTQNKKKRKK